MSEEVLNKPGEYSALREYASRPPSGYVRFDSETQSGLNLFALREDFDFASLEAVLDRIISALPAFRRIFSSPIIRLRDTGEILPVEAVRIINNNTLAHISVHSELWGDIKDGKLIPRKLMSIRQEDDYAIYENIVFARTVNVILRFISQNKAALRDILYSNREIRFNLLERENHPSYFLALGKLHIGYLRDYDKYMLPIGRCYEKILTVEKAIIPRLSMTVYKKCRKKGGKIELTKTNIFRSQKDYRRVYTLAKFFADSGIDQVSEHMISNDLDDYLIYCSMLSVFAAGHFNFKFDSDRMIDFKNIDICGSFFSWNLRIKREGNAISLTLIKDREYKVLLCASDTDTLADEKIRVSSDGYESLRLSIYDIDSFRRIQQMLLRAMIYSDEVHSECPFCGKELSKAEDAEHYECGACRTVIDRSICPESGKVYYSTGIKYYNRPKPGKYPQGGEYHYRNITRIAEDGKPICPHCGNKH